MAGAPARVDEPDDLEGDDEWDEPEPSYTWLHYIILVVVAFVLGLLVWNLINQEQFRPEETPAALELQVVPSPGTGGVR